MEDVELLLDVLRQERMALEVRDHLADVGDLVGPFSIHFD